MMWFNLSLYGTENLTAPIAYELADKIFKILEIKPTCFSHYTVNPKNDDLKIIYSKPEEMKIDLNKGLFKDFCWSDSLKKFQDEKIYFVYNENYGPYHGIEIGSYHADLLKKKLDIIIALICKQTKVKYGIFFGFKNMFNVRSYAFGADFINLYSYENSSLFDHDLRGLNEDEIIHFDSSKLRMVYTYNILNKNHMNIQINNQSLKEFILKNSDNGIIEKLNDYQFIWKVEEENIDRLNTVLGEAGVLISYEAPTPSPLKKPRLP